ncbi:hypothetical protein B0H19DRAFT_1253675 [Mycena capillaripes]|nr:hypothetical protein B0H19DRAFT_1253675 [Mycena capillaripes]
MAPKSWANDVQTLWLQGWMPDFITRQAEGKLHLFWPPMIEGWLKKWPEHANVGLPLPDDPDGRKLTPEDLLVLGAAIKKRKSQLENWFRNHRKTIGNATTGAVKVNSGLVQKIFKFSIPKRTRAHQAIEIFQLRNAAQIKEALTAAGYDALRKKKVAAEGDAADNDQEDADDEEDDWTDETEDTDAARAKRLKSARMRMRTHVVQGLWKAASQEERESCEAEAEEEKKKIREEDQRQEQLDALKATTPHDLQEGIDALDSVYTDIHKATFQASGWVGMSIMGGPNPRMNGDLTLKVICFGETPAGNDFEASCVDFDKNILEAFQAFLRVCYSVQSRKECALPSRPEATADEAPAERISIILPAPEAEKPKKPKNKKKKAKAKAKKSTALVEDSVPASPASSSASFWDQAGVASPGQDEGGDIFDEDITADSNWSVLSPAPSSSPRSLTPPPEVDQPRPTQLWPPGMSPPLSPASAEAIAMRERGGSVNGATMAIDPRLQELMAPSSPSPRPNAYPKPRPAFKGAPASEPSGAAIVAGPTVNVGGFNFPQVTPATPSGTSLTGSAYAPSALFLAFGGGRSPSPQQPAIPAVAAKTPSSEATPGNASSTARAIRQTLAPNATPFPVTPKLVAVAKVTPITSGLTSHATPGSQSTPGYASMAARAMAEIIAPKAAPAPVAPITVPLADDTTITPALTATAATEVPVMPGSRPRAKPVAKGTQPPRKKVAAAKADKKEASAAAAKKAATAQDGVKKRGRPARKVLDDITNEANASAADDMNVADAASAAPVATAAPAAPTYVYTTTNNNRHAAKRAADAEKAAKEKEVAEAKARQAAKGWIEATQQGTSTVILMRARKPKTFADGTVAQRQQVKARANPHSATEAALLARMEKGGNGKGKGKRKAETEPQTAVPTRKR